jgi:hypothetical protein
MTDTATSSSTAKCPAGTHDCNGTCASNMSVDSCGLRCMPCPVLAGTIAICDGNACSHRGEVLDQSCTAGTNLVAIINERFRYVAQIYTAGVTGVLSGIAVDVTSSSKFELRVTVRDVVNGSPGSMVLAATTLTTGGSAIRSVIRFAGTPRQVAGQQYAIVVDYPDAPPPPNLAGGWAGVTHDCYAGGYALASNDGTTWSRDDYDLHFEVFVIAD